jgi:hypothetical protein
MGGTEARRARASRVSALDAAQLLLRGAPRPDARPEPTDPLTTAEAALAHTAIRVSAARASVRRRRERAGQRSCPRDARGGHERAGNRRRDDTVEERSRALLSWSVPPSSRPSGRWSMLRSIAPRTMRHGRTTHQRGALMGRMPPLTAVLVIGTSGAGIVTGREPNPGAMPGQVRLRRARRPTRAPAHAHRPGHAARGVNVFTPRARNPAFVLRAR